MRKVACFVDGLNLHHSMRFGHHRWLNLNALVKRLIAGQGQSISAIHYFFAHAEWRPESYKRDRQYVAALEATGVNVVLGHFKQKERYCKLCKQASPGHEEKETDVNIALYMLNGAYKGSYDKAMLISRDGDLAPVLRMIRSEFPKLEVEVVAPPRFGWPNLRHSTELVQLATSEKKIRLRQIEACLFPRQVIDPRTGKIAATRPAAYDPPAS